MKVFFNSGSWPRAAAIAVVALGLLQGCAANSGAPRDGVVSGQKPFTTEAGEAGYQILLAEMALQRKDFDAASAAYRKAAELSDDVDVASRAANVAFEAGRLDDALASTRRWLKIDPDNTQAYRYKASIHLRQGQIGPAVESLRVVMNGLGETRGESFITMGRLLLDEPSPRAAMQGMQRLMEDDQELAEANYALGLLALRAGDMPVAHKSARRATNQKPAWSQAALLYARVLITGGQAEEGIEYARELVAQDADPAVRHEYAVLLAAVGRDEESREYLEALLLEQPDDIGTLRTAGLMALRTGDLDAAERHFTSLLASGQRSFEAIFYLATVSEERGEFSRAVRLYAQVRGGENVINAQVRAAHIVLRVAGIEPALDHLDRFAEQFPRYEADVIVVQGELLTETGDPGRALALYGEALQTHPDNESLLYARAFLLESQDHVDEAVQELRRIVELKPDDPIALNALGYTLADRTDNHREAHRLIRRALQLDPDNPAIIDSMGWVEYRRGKLDKALEHLWRAYNMVQDSEIAAHIGEVLWVLGRQDEARGVFTKALSVDPGSTVLENVMGRLGVQ